MTKSTGPHRALLALWLGAASLLAACGTADDSPSGPAALDLDGRTFIGDMATVDDAPYDLVSGSTIQLTFAGSLLTASAGCNTMSGPATWADGTLTLDDSLASTEMGCDPSLMDQDAWLADLLMSDPELTLDGETLAIENDTTVVTLIDEEVVVPDASLTGTVWRLESIATGQTVSSVPAGVTASVTFDNDGSLHAELGCNIGNGSFTKDSDTVQVGPLATTRKACGADESEVEAAMLSVLDGRSSYAIDGEGLTLTAMPSKSGGPSALSFRAATTGSVEG